MRAPRLRTKGQTGTTKANESFLVLGSHPKPQSLVGNGQMSRPQAVHQNSIDCYYAEEAKLSTRAAAILDWISEHGPHTDREVMRGMGFTEPNQVRPRITELIDANKLMEVGDVKCPVTGHRVRRVDVRRARIPTHQEPLFS